MQAQFLDFSKHAAELGELFWSSGKAEGSLGWYTTLVQNTLGPGERAGIVALQYEHGWRAALPLVHDSSGRRRALTAPYTTWFGPIATEPRFAEQLGRSLKSFVSSRLQLDCMDPSDAATAAFLSGAEECGLPQAHYRHFANWSDDITDFDCYWRNRPTRLQETIRRKRRHLEAKGRLNFVIVRASETIAAATQEFLNIYAKSWKPPEPHPTFMPAMLNALACEGTARLAFTVIDGFYAAAQVWLIRNQRAILFKLAHDPQFERYSPGTLLTHWMLAQLSAEGVAVVDFGRGDDAYKRDWLSSAVHRTGLIACNPRTVRGNYHVLTEVLPSRTAAWLAAQYTRTTLFSRSQTMPNLQHRSIFCES